MIGAGDDRTLSFLLGRVGRSLGVAVDEDELVRRLDALGAGAGDDAAFESAARAAGLRCEPLKKSLAALAESSAPGPLVGRFNVKGAVAFVVIVAAGRGTLLVLTDAEVRRESASALAARLGADAAAEVEWLVLSPLLPLAPIGHHATPTERLRALIRLERNDIAVVAAYAVAVGLLGLITPLAVQALVSTLTLGTVVQPLVILSVVVVVTLSVAGLLRTLQLYVVEMLQRRLFVRLVADLAWRLPRVTPEAGRDDSKLVNRFFDVLTVQKAAASLLLDGLTLVLEIAVGLSVLALYANVLLVFAVGLVLSLLFIVFVLGRGAIPTSIEESYAKHDVAGWIEEVVFHPAAFRSRAARRLGLTRAEALARNYLNARSRHFRVLLRQAIASFGVQAIAAAALLGVGGALVIDGTLTLGQLVAAELIVFALLAGLAKLPKQLEVAFDLYAAVDKIGALVDLPVEESSGAEVGDRALGFVVTDVEVGALVMPSFSVKSGEHIALLGKSGSGKSSLVDVVVGCRAVDVGRVAIDGDDVRHLSIEALRDRVGVARDIDVFAGTVAENLRVGQANTRPRDLVEALRTVELDDVILGRPEGLALGLQGTSSPLSSSEVHRLMIARALVGEPGLVFIDGSLDALDPELARRVLARLQRALAKTTLVVLTTRPDIAAQLPRTVEMTKDAA